MIDFEIVPSRMQTRTSTTAPRYLSLGGIDFRAKMLKGTGSDSGRMEVAINSESEGE